MASRFIARFCNGYDEDIDEYDDVENNSNIRNIGQHVALEERLRIIQRIVREHRERSQESENTNNLSRPFLDDDDDDDGDDYTFNRFITPEATPSLSRSKSFPNSNNNNNNNNNVVNATKLLPPTSENSGKPFFPEQSCEEKEPKEELKVQQKPKRYNNFTKKSLADTMVERSSDESSVTTSTSKDEEIKTVLSGVIRDDSMPFADQITFLEYGHSFLGNFSVFLGDDPNMDNMAESIVAMLNSGRFGHILHGVKTNTIIKGLDLNRARRDAYKQELDCLLKEKIKPRIIQQQYSLHFIPVRERRVIRNDKFVVEIFLSPGTKEKFVYQVVRKGKFIWTNDGCIEQLS